MTESSEGVIKTERVSTGFKLVWISRNRKSVQINERRLKKNENALI